MNWKKEAERMTRALVSEAMNGRNPESLIRLWINSGRLQRLSDDTIKTWCNQAVEMAAMLKNA